MGTNANLYKPMSTAEIDFLNSLHLQYPKLPVPLQEGFPKHPVQHKLLQSSC